jgi:phage minor structural protein
MRVRLNRLDRWGAKLGEVRDPLSAIHELGVDGTDSLSLDCFDDLQKGDHVRWRDEDTGQWFEHEVMDTVRTHDGAGRPVTRATCINHVCELFGDDVAAITYRDTSVAGVMGNLLRSTRWRYSDTGEYAGTYDFELGDTSVREAVAKVLETIGGGEMEATSGRVIRFHRELASASVTGRFTYGRDLGKVTREVSSEEVYTAVRAIGRDGMTETVYSNTALERWGRPPGAFQSGKQHRYCRLEAGDCADLAELRARATDRLAEVSAPKVTYTCDIGDIGPRRLGDLVQVVDATFDPELRMQARVTRITKDLLGGTRGGRVVLGSRPPRYMEIAFASIAGRTFRHYNG